MSALVNSGHAGRRDRCPLCLQKQTLLRVIGMSALCQQRTRAVQQTICANRYPKGAEGACLGSTQILAGAETRTLRAAEGLFIAAGTS